MRLQSAQTPLRKFVRPRNLLKLSRFGDCCQPAEITGFPPVINSAGSFHPVRHKARLKNSSRTLCGNSLQRARKRASTFARYKIRRRPKRKTIRKLKIAWRLCYSRKPFRELCPRMRTPERGQFGGLLNWMPKAAARIQRAAQTHQSLVLCSTSYTKPHGIAQGGNEK